MTPKVSSHEILQGGPAAKPPGKRGGKPNGRSSQAATDTAGDSAAPSLKTAPAYTSDGLPVFCSFTRMARIEELQPDPENWNEHPPEQLEMATKIFARGIRRPIRVSARSGLITAGHGALQVARYNGWKDWPVEIQQYDTRADEIADLTADNQLGKRARTNEGKLAAVLQQITGQLDIEIAGVTSEDLASLIERLDTGTADLVPVETKPVPETVWVLVGIPVDRWKEIAPQVEAISQVPGIEYHTGTGTAKVEPA